MEKRYTIGIIIISVIISLFFIVMLIISKTNHRIANEQQKYVEEHKEETVTPSEAINTNLNTVNTIMDKMPSIFTMMFIAMAIFMVMDVFKKLRID